MNGTKPMRKLTLALAALTLTALPATAQSEFEGPLCEAAEQGQTIELVYDQDAAKGCEPRIVDVHQVGLGKNGLL